MAGKFGRWVWLGNQYAEGKMDLPHMTVRLGCPECGSKHSEFLINGQMVANGFLKYRRYCTWCGAKLVDEEGGNA